MRKRIITFVLSLALIIAGLWQLKPQQVSAAGDKYVITCEEDSSYYFGTYDSRELARKIRQQASDDHVAGGIVRNYNVTLNDDLELIGDDAYSNLVFYGPCNWNLNGKGHTISKVPKSGYVAGSSGEALVSFIGTIGYPNTTYQAKDVTVDGGENFICITLNEGKLSLLKGVVVKNGCTQTSYTAGIHMWPNSKLTIDGAKFENNKSIKSGYGGAIYCQDGCELDIKNASFSDNKVVKTGGAIYIRKGAKRASIINSVFNNNSAEYGGAVYSTYADSNEPMELKDVTFNNNEASLGGALYLNCPANISSASFSENTSTKRGGAIYVGKGSLTVEESNFSSNVASGQGGGIYLRSGNLSVIESLFKENVANSGGGGIFINHSTKTTSKILNSEFTENGSNYGGGLYLGINSKLNIESSKFNKNEAGYGGAVYAAFYSSMYPSLSGVEISTATFEGNKALQGGAIFTGSPTKIKSSSFKGNQALSHQQDSQTNPHSSGTGGAVGVMNNETNIESSVFENNWAFGSGGAISINGYLKDDNGNITGAKPNIKVNISNNTEFTNNEVSVGQGGAIYVSPYSYKYHDGKNYNIDQAYKPLNTDATTVFLGNKSGEGLFNPPDNYEDFTNLKFADKSDVTHGLLTRKSLLNNYDVNYHELDKILLAFNANGGTMTKDPNKDWVTLSDNKEILLWERPKDTELKLAKSPTRPGYEFLGWKLEGDTSDKIYKAEEEFKLEKHSVFLAQWKKNESKPNTEDFILKIIKVDGDGNRISLPVSFKLTDKAYPSLGKTLITNNRGEAEINSLSSGDYKLEEIATPEGYKPLEEPVEFTVVGGKAVRYEGKLVRYIYVTNDKKATGSITEIDGKNRQDVAVDVSKNYFPDAKKLILVQDMAYADSMSAMNISKGQIPILYVGKDTLYDVTKAEILRTKRDEIYVMGGVNTITKRLFEEVKGLNHGKVTRVYGSDRFEVNKNSLEYFGDYKKAVIASGMIYTDALSSVPYAHQENAPILLVRKSSVPEYVANAIEKADEAILSGGPNTVDETCKGQIDKLLGKSVDRIDGKDRYAVSAKLAGLVKDPKTAIVTSGEKWSDALTAGPLAQKLGAPILLTAQSKLPQLISDYLEARRGIEELIIIGGPASVGSQVREALKALYK